MQMRWIEKLGQSLLMFLLDVDPVNFLRSVCAKGLHAGIRQPQIIGHAKYFDAVHGM